MKVNRKDLQVCLDGIIVVILEQQVRKNEIEIERWEEQQKKTITKPKENKIYKKKKIHTHT